MMSQIRTIEIKKSVFEDNTIKADELRRELKNQKTFLLNLMSSLGSGKTSTVMGTIDRIRDRFKMGVIEADIDSVVDAEESRFKRSSGHSASNWRPLSCGCDNDQGRFRRPQNERIGYCHSRKCWQSCLSC